MLNHEVLHSSSSRRAVTYPNSSCVCACAYRLEVVCCCWGLEPREKGGGVWRRRIFSLFFSPLPPPLFFLLMFSSVALPHLVQVWLNVEACLCECVWNSSCFGLFMGSYSLPSFLKGWVLWASVCILQGTITYRRKLFIVMGDYKSENFQWISATEMTYSFIYFILFFLQDIEYQDGRPVIEGERGNTLFQYGDRSAWRGTG